MSGSLINLYSDTQTQPTAPMRAAMAAAPVGDEQRGEDPTVNELCERVATLLGMEQAVFLPSGTMANELAIRVHCRPGDEIIAERTSHIINFEGGGPAAISGAMIQAVPGERGVFTAEQARAAIRPASRYFPPTRLIEIEQTANMGGGTVWPLETVGAVCAVGHEHGLRLHLDGARLMNAVVASGVPAADYAAGFDTAWIDLSKGLGCPVGAVLAGSSDVIESVWQWKQRLGGAMRQAGIIAAAGIYALDHHVDRLADDHRNARRFAEGIAELPGVAVEPDHVDTNIVFFDVAATGRDAETLAGGLETRGVRIGAMGPTLMRAVTHLDVDAGGIEQAVEALGAELGR